MSREFQEKLRELKTVVPPPGLEDRVIKVVRREARRQRFMARLLALGLAASVAMTAWSIGLLLHDLALSPFESLFKLAFSDSALVLSSGLDWGLALAESLPAGALALTVGSLWAAALLLRRIVESSGLRHDFTRKAA
jgi:hypothetical protein